MLKKRINLGRGYGAAQDRYAAPGIPACRTKNQLVASTKPNSRFAPFLGRAERADHGSGRSSSVLDNSCSDLMAEARRLLFLRAWRSSFAQRIEQQSKRVTCELRPLQILSSFSHSATRPRRQLAVRAYIISQPAAETIASPTA